MKSRTMRLVSFDQNFVCISHFSHVCHYPAHASKLKINILKWENNFLLKHDETAN
jgi:hypothetical protein